MVTLLDECEICDYIFLWDVCYNIETVLISIVDVVYNQDRPIPQEKLINKKSLGKLIWKFFFYDNLYIWIPVEIGNLVNLTWLSLSDRNSTRMKSY